MAAPAIHLAHDVEHEQVDVPVQSFVVQEQLCQVGQVLQQWRGCMIGHRAKAVHPPPQCSAVRASHLQQGSASSAASARRSCSPTRGVQVKLLPCAELGQEQLRTWQYNFSLRPSTSNMASPLWR